MLMRANSISRRPIIVMWMVSLISLHKANLIPTSILLLLILPDSLVMRFPTRFSLRLSSYNDTFYLLRLLTTRTSGILPIRSSVSMQGRLVSKLAIRWKLAIALFLLQPVAATISSAFCSTIATKILINALPMPEHYSIGDSRYQSCLLQLRLQPRENEGRMSPPLSSRGKTILNFPHLRVKLRNVVRLTPKGSILSLTTPARSGLNHTKTLLP